MAADTKKITLRKVNLAFVRGVVERAGRALSIPEIAEATGLIHTTVGQLLNDLEREGVVTRYGHRSSAGGGGVRFGPYTAPEVVVHVFKPLKPLKPTVIPVREGGRLAPEIYTDVTFIGAAS